MSDHILYAVELAVFAFVGLGWLSARELLGGTPVLDVAVLVCVAVLGCINLVLALVLYTAEQFERAARAFFSQALALWALYCYGLLCTTGEGALQCKGGTHSAGKTYAAAYFGGLPYHQAPAAFTLAFLTFVVVLAAGQVRSCGLPPSSWLSQCTGQAVLVLLTLHLVLFLCLAPLPVGYVGGGVILAMLLVLEFASMLRIDFVRAAAGVDNEQDRQIQYILEWVLHGLVIVTALVLSWALCAQFPTGFFFFSTVVLAGQGFAQWWQDGMPVLGSEFGPARELVPRGEFVPRGGFGQRGEFGSTGEFGPRAPGQRQGRRW